MEEDIKKVESFIDGLVEYFELNASFKKYILDIFSKRKFSDEKEMFEFLSREIVKNTKLNKDIIVDKFISLNKKFILQDEK